MEMTRIVFFVFYNFPVAATISKPDRLNLNSFRVTKDFLNKIATPPPGFLLDLDGRSLQIHPISCSFSSPHKAASVALVGVSHVSDTVIKVVLSSSKDLTTDCIFGRRLLAFVT